MREELAASLAKIRDDAFTGDYKSQLLQKERDVEQLRGHHAQAKECVSSLEHETQGLQEKLRQAQVTCDACEQRLRELGGSGEGCAQQLETKVYKTVVLLPIPI